MTAICPIHGPIYFTTANLRCPLCHCLAAQGPSQLQTWPRDAAWQNVMDSRLIGLWRAELGAPVETYPRVA